MLHPDYQYDATRIPDLVAPILAGEADLVLGSRFLGDPLAGGMPRWKFVSNRFLTGVENAAFGLHLSEYHTGLRAYRTRRLLERIPYQLNSDDFVFDQDLIAQVVAARGLNIAEIAVPTRYFEEATSVGFQRSVVYGLSTLRVVGRYLLHRSGLRRSARLQPRPTSSEPRASADDALPRWPRPGGRRGRHLHRRPGPRLPLGRRRVGLETLKTADPRWIAVLFVFVIADVLLRAVRWRVLLSPVAAVPFPTTLASLLVGYLANNVLPARLGEVVRSHDPGRDRPVAAIILGTIVIERVVDTMVVVSIAAAAILVLSVRGIVASAVLVGFALTSLLVVIVAVGIYAHRLPGADRVRVFLGRWPRVRHVLVRLRDGLAVANNVRAMAIAVVLSIGSWTCTVLAFAAAAQAVGVEPTIGQAALLAAGTNLATAIPAGPGYVGTFEVATVTIAASVGIDKEPALAFAILVHVATLAVTSIGGAIVLIFGGRGRRAVVPHREVSLVVGEPAPPEAAKPSPDR